MEKLFPDYFLKKEKWAYIWINSQNFYTVYFYCMLSLSWGISKYIEIKLQITYFYFIYSSFKNKKKSGSSPASLTVWFLKKNISLVIFYYLTKCEYLVAMTSWDIEQYVYCNYLLTRLWRYKFWNWPCISNQIVFSIWPENILRTKIAFKMRFFIIFKRLSLIYKKTFFGRWECDFKSTNKTT